MPVWLVTGGSGFLGRHVLAALPEAAPCGTDIVVLGRRCPSGWPASRFVEADLSDLARVRAVLRTLDLETVLHLAGKTPPATPEQLYLGNTVTTALLLDALQELGRPVRVVLAGSAAELGPVAEEDLPVGEEYLCRPADSYGRSKWLATSAALAARPPLETVVARLFNPIGPGIPESQAFGRFAALLASPENDPLRVGDLDSRRDFIDIRDAARALIALALRGRPRLVYHVGTGQSRRVGDGLDHLLRRSGRSLEVRIEPQWARPVGPRDSRADIRRITEHTGWRPEVCWEQSLDDLWHEARARFPLTE